ncbi:MAG TPA: hypothetical protein VIM11_07635, partial [Tepidisphaeraceae bacterium]
PQAPPRTPPTDALRDAFSKFNELKEFAAYYASVRLDILKVTVRNLGIYLALGVIGLIAVASMAVTAVVLLLRGIAGAFAQLFSGHPWLGDLITAVLVLALMAGAIVFVMKKLTGTFRSLTVKKYEDRLRRERQELGRDVHERAKSVE